MVWHLGQVRAGDLVFTTAIMAITLASLLLNPAFYEDTELQRFSADYATSYLVFLVSLPMAIGVMAGLRLLVPESLASAALAAAVLILTGVAAEHFAGLSAVSEPVRAALFANEIIYAEDFRDQLIYGAVRAKLFTSEPSHVAKAFVLALMAWYAVSTGFCRIPVLYGLLAAGVLLVKSPGIMMVLPAIWACDLCRRRGSGGLGLFVLGGVLAAIAAALAGQALFPDRFAHITSGRDSSFIIRASLPWEILAQVWAKHPMFGLGFGAKESGIPYAISAGGALSRDLNFLLGTNAPLGNNDLFIGMIQLGLVGSVLFAAALLWFWRFSCGAYWPFAAAALGGYLTLIGGINDPRFWGGFALITAAGAAAARLDETRRDGRPALRQSAQR